MNQPPAGKSLLGGWPRLGPWLAVALVLLCACILRWRMLDVPLERDEGEYAYAGQLILQGIPPYELACNMKLPGVYYAYAAGMAIFGQTPAGVHLTLLVVNSLTCVLVFLFGRNLFGPAAGVAGCAVFALMSAGIQVIGLAAHATQFVVLFAVPGVWLLWRAMESNQRRTFFFSGLFLGLAFLMKQPAACYGLFGAICLAVHALRKRSFFTRDFAITAALFLGAMLLPLAFFCLAALVAGDFGNFWFWVFDYAAYYATACPLAAGLRNLGNYVAGQLYPYAGFLLLAIVGLVLAWPRRELRLRLVFVLALFFFSFLGTVPDFYFRPHYFVMVLPAAAILVGMAFASLLSIKRPFGPVLAPVLFIGALGWAVASQTHFLFPDSPAVYVEGAYADNPFAESLKVGQYIQAHSQSDDRVAVIGSEPEIYFYSHRLSATSYIYAYPLVEEHPYTSRMQHDMMAQIEAAKPKFVVMVMYKYSWLMDNQSDPTILRWEENYTRQFYDPVVMSGRKPDGQSVWAEGGDMNEARRQLREFILIFQRKPNL